MAQSDIEFKVGDIVVVGDWTGLPAETPYGLHVGQKSQIDRVWWTKGTVSTASHLGFPPRLRIHLRGHPPDWWYDAVWFESSG